MTEIASTASEVFRRLGGDNHWCGNASYVAIPGNDKARWLLPAGRSEVADVLASWTPYRFKSRAGWTAMRMSSKLLPVNRLPGTLKVEVDGLRAPDWRALGWRGHEAPVALVYLGTPGPTRKAVVHLVEPGTGKCAAVVKVPLTERAKLAVLREAEVLETLSGERFEHAPRLLYVDLVKGIATQTFVEGHSASRAMEQGVLRLLRSLLLASKTTSLSAHAGRWAAQLGNGMHESCVAPVLRQMQDDSALPGCWQHGDFAPWNIKRKPDGRCALVDWEDAQRNALPLQDAFHFLHIQDLLFGAKPALHAKEMQPEAAGMGLSAKQCEKLEAAYLLGALVQCTQRENLQRRRFVAATLALWQEQNA